MIWLDAIDTPFVRNMNAIFYEQYSSMKQPVVDASDSVQLDAGWTRPRWRSVDAERGLAVAYKWSSTYDQLKRLAHKDGSPHDGVILEYVNPITGGAALPTMDCHVQMLRGGEETKTHRHTSGAVYFVIQGEGETVAGDQGFRWSKGDGFVVPNGSAPPSEPCSRRCLTFECQRRAVAEGGAALSRRGGELSRSLSGSDISEEKIGDDDPLWPMHRVIRSKVLP